VSKAAGSRRRLRSPLRGHAAHHVADVFG
jgi:hypothetical protein